MSGHMETSEAAHGLEDDSWLDKWWPLFLIIFGISCILFLATFEPYNQPNATPVTQPNAAFQPNTAPADQAK